MKQSVVYILMLPLVILSNFAIGQDIDKYYTHHVQEGGDIFFIYQNDDFKNESNKTAFLFDITHRQGSDSLTINFTYRTNDPDPAQKLIIHTSDKELSSPVEKLFVDFTKRKWEHRFTARFSFFDIESMMNNQKQPKFTIITNGGRSDFIVKPGKWEKYASALQKIFYIMSQN